MRPVRSLAASAVLAIAATSQAAMIVTLTPTGVYSDGGSFGAATNGTYTYTVSGLSNPWTVETIGVSATIDKVQTNDAASEKRLGVTIGSTSTSGFNPGFPSYSGTRARSSVSNVNWNVTDAIINNGSTVTFKFYESIDDNLAGGGRDADYSALSLVLNGSPYIVTPPTVSAANQFGTLSGNNLTASKPASILSTGEVDWYSFTVDNSVNGANGYRYLDLDTNYATGTTALDTELALYAADGTLIANDDEDGTGTKSALSFGAGSNTRQNPGDTTAINSNGRDGSSLAPGTYYVAVAPFNASFANGFLVTGSGTSSGGYNMNITLGTLAPEPTSLAAAALAGFAVARRRR